MLLMLENEPKASFMLSMNFTVAFYSSKQYIPIIKASMSTREAV